MPDKRPSIHTAKEHILNIFKHIYRKEEKFIQRNISNTLTEKINIIQKNIKHRKSVQLIQEDKIYKQQ